MSNEASESKEDFLSTSLPDATQPSTPTFSLTIAPPSPTEEATNIATMTTSKPPADCYLLSLNDFLPESPVSYGNDSFLSLVGISHEDGHICPQQYMDASKERRVLYVKGLPVGWTPTKVKEFFGEWFKAFGRVEIVVTIHDLTAKATSRWIIVDTSVAAMYFEEVLARAQGVPCTKEALGDEGGFVLRGCLANVPEVSWLEHYINTFTAGPIFWDREPTRPPKGTSYLDDAFLTTTTLKVQSSTSSIPSTSGHGHPSRTQERSAIASEPQVQPGQLAPSSDVTQTQHNRVISPTMPEISSMLRNISQSPAPEASSSTNPLQDATPFVPLAQSWAKITEAASPNKGNVDLKPEAKRENKAPRLLSTGRIPSIEASQVPTTEPMIEQMRVVFLLNLPQHITLQDVSDAITEGPVMSIRFGHNVDDGTRYAGIIFHYAETAEQFYQALVKEKANSTPGRFRFIVDVVRGEAYPADETINAMNQAPWATRRLTLVKKGFFFVVGERVLRRLCEKCVGEESIQIVFLYNGGNATIVFSEVAAAIKFRREVEDKIALKKEPWAGLQVTFSKDPCEIPLRLISAMGTGMADWQ